MLYILPVFLLLAFAMNCCKKESKDNDSDDVPSAQEIIGDTSTGGVFNLLYSSSNLAGWDG